MLGEPMAEIKFERLISRKVALSIARELDLAGSKMTVNQITSIGIMGGFVAFIATATVLFKLKYSILIYALGGIFAAGLLLLALYFMVEYQIDRRRTKMEDMLPDFLQVLSASMRGGAALDRALLMSARPEFTVFSEDIRTLSKSVYSGETMENALINLTLKYKSEQLRHAIRIILEAMRYGSPMADITDNISKDLKTQQIIQKEVGSQVFMYALFIAFAGIVAAPVLFGLTSNMISVTDQVWKSILATNPGGLPSTGIALLRPSPPQITVSEYQLFAIVATALITGFAGIIMSTIMSGSAIKGLRYAPLFALIGIGIFLLVQHVIASLFAGLSAI